MELPLVSIIVPAYNAEKYLKRALESIFLQTYKNIEIIVVDDGSADRTGEIARFFAEKGARYIRQENKGVAAARNTGIRTANGEYIAFLDADDMYAPEKIAKEVKFLKDHPEFDLVYCNTKHFFEEKPDVFYKLKRPFYSGEVFEKLLRGSFGQSNTVLIPKRIFEKVGFFDESSRHSEEWDMFLRIARAGYRVGFLGEDLVIMQMSNTSLSRFENQWEMKLHILQVFERLFASMPHEERIRYGSERILARSRFQLAIAYLAAGRKGECVHILSGLWRTPALSKSILYCPVLIFVLFVPAVILRGIVTKLWAIKQRRLFYGVLPPKPKSFSA